MAVEEEKGRFTSSALTNASVTCTQFRRQIAYVWTRRPCSFIQQQLIANPRLVPDLQDSLQGRTEERREYHIAIKHSRA